MKQIIPFRKELSFKTKVSEITSISLEREVSTLDDGIISGVFHIIGDYKMNEGSINREKFSFDLPFDITLDPRYDINTVTADIEDFYYDVIDEELLKVSIDLFVEAEYLEETEEEEDTFEIEDEVREDVIEDTKDIDIICDDFKDEVIVCEDKSVERNDNTMINDITDLTGDLFSNLDNTETYTTYYVYIVKEDDNVQKILDKYGITKEEFEYYNDIMDIKPGDKVIIPKSSE